MGHRLKEAALRFAILEAGAAAGGSWRSYYDTLVLFSPARYSSLPGLPFPGDPDHYPARDEVVAYLQGYAAKLELPVSPNARVDAVERDGGLFRVVTSSGESLLTRSVIAATGSFGNPYIPELPGRSGYRGVVLHAFDYREPSPFAGQRVVVVGGANSAVQIGVELARVARVTLALRSRIIWMPQRILGKDGHFWLRVTGLDRSRFLRDQSTPVVDAGHYRAAVVAGRPDTRRMFTRFTDQGVVWRDGTQENVDAVVLATGYRPSLQYLSGLGALDARGRPRQKGGVSRNVPGLYYMGLSGQRNFASATLRGVGPDAEVVARHLLRFLRDGD
jgi:putative flavoprotein involved in K+ transport